MATKVIPLSGKKRIYLVDDQPLVREWFTYVLNKEPDLAVWGEAANIASAVRGITDSHPHVAIIDLAFEDGSGFDLIEKINTRCPTTGVLVVSSHDEASYAHRVLRTGARGYISKREPTKKIIVALRCVLQGKIYLGPDAVQRLAGNRTANKMRSVEMLSDREIEVFAMLGRGLGTRRIAAMLHVSPKTIHAYHARIKVKLQLRDGTELLREAIRWIEKVARPSARVHKTDHRPLTGVIALSE